jgi:HAMP domain-containing protein
LFFLLKIMTDAADLELLIVIVVGDDVQLKDVADGAKRVVAAGEVAYVGVGYGQHGDGLVPIDVAGQLRLIEQLVELRELVVLPRICRMSNLSAAVSAHMPAPPPPSPQPAAAVGPLPVSFGWLASGWGQGDFLSEAQQ